MSMIETYLRRMQTKRDEITKLQNDKAKIIKKISDLSSRCNSASQMLSRTSSTSTYNSKLREIERHSNEIAKQEKALANIEGKIANKHKELDTAQNALSREEKKVQDKQRRESEKSAREHQSRMRSMQNTLDSHEQMHTHTRNILDKVRILPDAISVLFFASNPLDQKQLRLDEEARAINEMIRKSEHRDSVKLISHWAVRPLDILQALNENQPSIVHFSGHGSEQDEIVFQDNMGQAKCVSKDAIVQTMMASSDSIRLVFFNTCYSRNQADAVTEHVEAAIGMKTTIGDDAARVFAAQFY